MCARKKEPRPVLMVHGVASNGDWQDEIEATLRPFFGPVQVRYSQYRGRLGALLVVCEPWIIVVALIVTIVLMEMNIATWDSVAIGSVILLVAVLPVGVKWRRHLALKRYMRIAGEHLDRTPHVIAHSFGTYLTARLLESVRGSELCRIVLCGCVLPREFNWQTYVDACRVKGVRNDYTCNDWVGIAARLAGQLHSNLGNAGTHGFHHTLQYVHKVRSPDEHCVLCQQPRTESSIHDVDCSGLGHSDGLLIASHCKMWWLPYLWGFDPAEHRALVRLCRDWVESAGDDEKMAEIEAKLDATRWNWCRRSTILSFLQMELASRNSPHSQDDVLRAFNRFAIKVDVASNVALNNPAAQCLHFDVAMNEVLAAGV